MGRTYIMGYGRSGSTVFEALLQSQHQLHAFGEVKYLAERGALKNETCGCGQAAHVCDLWGPIIADMGQDWDFAQIATLTDKFESSKTFFITLLRVRLGQLRDDLATYKAFNRALFARLDAHGPFIESSKMPARAFFLSYEETAPVFDDIYWFVRDPRGVAWSCMKDVDRPEAKEASDAKMPRFGYYTSILKWLLNTAVSAYVARRIGGVTVKRYEDVMAEAAGQDITIADHVLSHSISGNPGRLAGNMHRVTPDAEWKTRLNRKQKTFGYLLCAPFMRRLSYRNE